MTDDVVAAAIAVLRDRGFDVIRPDDAGAPAAVATPTPGAGPVLTHRPADRRPVAVEAPTTDPTTILHHVAAAADAGRLCLFAASPDVAAAIAAVLADGGVRARETASRRFYDLPDRIACTDGSLAAVRTDTPDRLAWVHDETTDRLTLLDDGRRVAVLDGVDALACPGPAPAAFPYTYRRGEDKRVHVTDRHGREVGVFPTIRAMKHEAYAPVAEPLIPEFVFQAPTRLSDAWAVAVVEDGGVTGFRSG